jgi:hypothetical protein
MTAADCHLQTLVRQQLGHLRVESSELYIRADTTAAAKYIEGVERIAVRRLGHLRIDTSELYIRTDTTAAFEYPESGVITVVDAAQPADEGEETP